MKSKLTKLLTRWDFLAVAGVFILVLVLSYLTFFTPNYYTANQPVIFDIKKGESFSSVVDRLHNQGIIPSKNNFKIAGFVYGAERKIRAARFHIPNGLSYLDLLDLFISGDCDFQRTLTIRPGQTIKWLAHRLQKYVYIDSTEFVNLASSKVFADSLGLKQNSFEGYLFATDYEIFERSSPEEALRIFYDAFKEFYNDSLKARTKELGFTIHEIITLASIIKGETHKEEEMSRISGVYHNRLRIGMKLQADPTIQYVIPGGWKRLTYKDLELDSPYNTYKYFGLPPGPINSPGQPAIMAALYPEKNNYLYFVADGTGGHRFGKTLAEHNRNVKLYREYVRKTKD
ncbi:MAG: endolytic transglycosylase MltG [Ignavibacteriaceae bacterium]|nr:endolytic transglycosylase MltG [Ignavibacteriaceae bacterium]